MNQFENLEDVLQHFGVKGMKWGVVKRITQKGKNIKARGRADKNVIKRRKAGEITAKQAKAEKWQNFHKLQMQNSKVYNKSYTKRVAAGQDPKKAMRKAFNDAQRRKRMLIALGTAATDPKVITAVTRGKDILGN